MQETTIAPAVKGMVAAKIFCPRCLEWQFPISANFLACYLCGTDAAAAPPATSSLDVV